MWFLNHVGIEVNPGKWKGPRNLLCRRCKIIFCINFKLYGTFTHTRIDTRTWYGQVSISCPCRPVHVRITSMLCPPRSPGPNLSVRLFWDSQNNWHGQMSVSNPYHLRVISVSSSATSVLHPCHDRLISVSIVRITSGCEFGWNLGCCPPRTTI